jgi:hypothetical protein
MQQAATTTFRSPAENASGASNGSPSERGQQREEAELPSASERRARRRARGGEGGAEEEKQERQQSPGRQSPAKQQRRRPRSREPSPFTRLSEKRNVLFIEDGCLDSLDSNLDYALTLPKSYEPEYPTSGPPPGPPLDYAGRQSLMDMEVMDDLPRTFSGGHQRYVRMRRKRMKNKKKEEKAGITL